MKLQSERKTIKSISKWRFAVTLSQDTKGIYHVVSENLITSKITSSSLVDYGMACFAFDTQISNFEGDC